MAEIDGSIPASVKVPENNIGATFANLTALQGQILNNRMLGMKIAGQTATGRAVQANTDADGNVNDLGVNRAVAADPSAAYVAADSAKAMQELHNAHVLGATQELQRQFAAGSLTTQGLEQSGIENKNGGDVAASLLLNRDKVPLTKPNVANAVAEAIAAGRIKTPQGIAHAMSLVSDMSDDPKQNEGLLNQAYLGANATAEAVNTVRGQIQNIDEGGQIQQYRVDPVTGERTAIGQPIAKTLAPQILPTIGADNRPHATVVGGGTPAAGGERNGRYPSGGQSGDLGATGFAPGEAPTMEASAKAYQDDVASVPSLRKIMTTFDQAQTALAGAQTGKGSDILQNLRGLADTYGIPINTKATDAYQEASKWMNSALTQESSRLGLNTDASRAIMAEAQPGVQTVHGAAVKMLPVLQGLKAMDLAAPVIAQKQGVSPQQYSTWRSQWANSIDPLAFSANHTTKTERAANWKRMTAEQRARYTAGVGAAIDAGIYSADDLAK